MPSQSGRLTHSRVVRYIAITPGQFSTGTDGQFSTGSNKQIRCGPKKQIAEAGAAVEIVIYRGTL